jgi:hypothetical protein
MNGGPMPLTPTQELFWLIETMKPGAGLGPEFTIWASYWVTGSLDVDRLSDALTNVVARQGALRACVVVGDDGVPAQEIRSAGRCGVEVVDADPTCRTAYDIAKEHAARRVDVTRSPLVRVLASRLGDDWVVTLNAHHSAVDPWSLGVLASDLVDEYSGRAPIGRYPAPARAAPSDAMRQSTMYWREQMRDAVPLRFPPDIAAEWAVADSGFYAFDFDANALQSLDALVHAERATVFMGFFAAFIALAACHTGQRDLVVPTMFSSRLEAEDDKRVGFVLDPLAVRVRLPDDPTLTDVLRTVRGTVIDAYEHRNVPIVNLLTEIPEVGALLANEEQPWCLFQQIDLPPAQELEGRGTRWQLLVDREPGSEWRASLPLDFEFAVMRRGPDDTYGLISYNSKVCDREFAEKVGQEYRDVLGLMTSAGETRLREVGRRLAIREAQTSVLVAGR